MLAKRNRLNLRKCEDFFNKSRKKTGLFFRFYYLNDTLKKTKRFAVIIPKKVVNKATQRNKLKRIIYQLINKSIKLEQDCGLVGVFVLIKDCSKNDRKQQFRREINKILRNSKDTFLFIRDYS